MHKQTFQQEQWGVTESFFKGFASVLMIFFYTFLRSNSVILQIGLGFCSSVLYNIRFRRVTYMFSLNHETS